MSSSGYATSMLPAADQAEGPSEVARSSGEHPSTVALRTGPALHPGCDHQLQSMSLDTVRSFALRTQNFYQALEMIARYLPPQGPSAIEAMELVTSQRKWMYDVGCAVGKVIGTFYQLEKNTLAELQLMWQTAQQDMPVGSMKKNFRATLENLRLMAEYRKEAEDTIKTCEDYANTCIQWHGQELKVQHAVMELLRKYGGSAECEALIDDIRKCTETLTKAQENASKAFKRVAELRGSQEEAECQALVLESIANNEKGSLATLMQRAEEADKDAAKKQTEAASTFNVAYKVRKHGFFSSWWVTDWVDNKGDVARWRAERLKDYAKQAKDAESDQQERAKKAAKVAAEVKNKLTVIAEELQEAEKHFEEKDEEVQKAKEALLEVRGRSDALRKDFGNISLSHIAALRDHMQKFPELLGAQGMEDSGMFASMKGALLQHQRLCKRMQLFLEEPDDAQCKHMMKDLTPAISQAIADAQFFSKRMEPLKNKMDACLQQMPAPQALPQHSQSDSIALDNASDGSFEKVNMRGEADSDDELW